MSVGRDSCSSAALLRAYFVVNTHECIGPGGLPTPDENKKQRY